MPLTTKARLLDTLRTSQIYEAIPQVTQEDLSNISEILRKMELSLDPKVLESMEEKKWIAKALNISYDPQMPIEEYLDIIGPRRKKINSLINEVISGKSKEHHLAKINDEIWEINEEISSSKSIESFTFLTNFISGNAEVFFGMLIGGLVGYSSANFVGCGLGSMTGPILGKVGKIIGKHYARDLNIPKYPRKTMEWIKEKIENPKERFLAMMLSKDIKVIQVWSLRKELKSIVDPLKQAPLDLLKSLSIIC